jgi:hypothetical protein
MAAVVTAVQKIRQTLTGSPIGEPDFPSEGEYVIRWLTGGTSSDAWVTFHQESEQITVRCAGCRTIIGHLPVDHFAKDDSVKLIGMLRETGHEQHKPADWPRTKVIPQVH